MTMMMVQKRRVSLVSRGYALPTLILPPLDSAADRQSFVEQLSAKIRLSPLFFKETPIIIEPHPAMPSPSPQELAVALKAIAALGLRVAGLGAGFGADHANDAALPLFVPTTAGGKSGDEAAAEPVAKAQPVQGDAAEPQAPRPALVVSGSVRSGQQVYAQGRDLVVLGSANTGSELLSDGDIHVYGKLKGKALAGLAGNVGARIYAQAFDPELVAVGNVYVQCDAIGPEHVADSPVSVHVADPSSESPELAFTSFEVKTSAV